MIIASVSEDEILDLLDDCSEAELGVGMFVGMLTQLNKAGVDFGITPGQLNQLLVAINVAYEELTTIGVGRPN